MPQQDDPGSVGVDLPFPESGMVPCYVLYGVMGIEATAAGLRRILAAIRAPCSVKAKGRVRRPPWRGEGIWHLTGSRPRDCSGTGNKLEIANCDFKLDDSSDVIWKQKSLGKRARFRLTASFKRKVFTP